MTHPTLFIWRAALVLIAGFLLWQIVARGLGAHYADRLERGDADAMEQVLTWQPTHPRALYEQGRRLAAEDPAAALQTLTQAHRANPTDPRPLLAIAAIYLESERTADADALMHIADRLTPVDPRVQQQLALYWNQRGETPEALRHLSKAMTVSSWHRRENYPVMLALAEDPALRPLLEPLALQAPAWWPGFFRHAANRAQSTDIVRYLFDLSRRAGAGPISEAEHTAYQNRLLRDGFATEAYLSWLNTLEPRARKELGLLFNGGFELPLRNAGFGWRVRSHDQLEIRPLRTQGSSGSASLMVRFRAFEDRFTHLSQRLILQRGTYRLTGRARVNGLETKGGVRWQVRCSGSGRNLLGRSRVPVGDAHWSELSFDFEVPADDCETQDLRLVSAGTHGFELDIDGLLWLDDLKITRTTGLDASTHADTLRDR